MSFFTSPATSTSNPNPNPGGFGTGGGFGTTGFGGFGATTTTTSAPSFSTGFGATPSFSFGPAPLLGQTQTLQLQQPQPQIDESQALQQSVFRCQKFGDERDGTLAAFNFLQACWGTGQGLYSQTLPSVKYNQTNPFFRFKAVGFAYMYTDSNEDGLVVVNFKKPQNVINMEESNIVTQLQNLLQRPNIIIRFDGTKAVSEEATVAIIFAEDKHTLRRIPATDMAAALCDQRFKLQLEGMGVTNINPKVKPSPEQLKRYLENPPDGIDPRVWTKAQEDNPDPKAMIPVPLIGFEALKSRIDWQEKETLQHHARLKLIAEDVTNLLNKHANLTAELQQMKRKHIVLAHRLISVICRQELMRKQGTTLSPDEEALKKKLEEMDLELNSPTHYKGRLNELLSQIRLHRSSLESKHGPRYSIDTSTIGPVKEFLGIQQESVWHLVNTAKRDQECVKEMTDKINAILKTS